MIRTSIFIGGGRITDNDFTSVAINQKIGGHHTFEIRLRQDAKKGILLEKTKSWIGEAVSIGFDHHEDRNILSMPVDDVFKGIATSVELSRKSGTGELVVKGHSPTIVMDDGPYTRSFTDSGLQELVDKVIKPYKAAFPETPLIEPVQKTASIPYTVQYKESNFSFINRLANRFGEWFYYDGIHLHFGKLGDADTIDLDFGENGMKYFDIAVQAAPTQIELKGYDYKTDKVITEESPSVIKSNDLANEAFSLGAQNIFSQTPKTNVQTDLEASDLQEISKRREQIAADEIVVLSGVSASCKIRPGAKISIKDKLIGENYGEYIVIRSSHNIGQGGDYSNSFEAIPAELNLPPLSTMPDPPFCETQLATVTETNDEGAMGRVRVEMFWQQGTGETTPWIRVASPYMGKDKGFYIIPEIGDQVLVAFENNHPDKPYVLSGMYHGNANPEWFDTENRYKGFKSAGRNQWKFDDKNQSIYMMAPNAMTLHAGNKITLKTDGEEESEIHVNVGDGTVSIVAKHITVDSAETITVNCGKEISTTSGEIISVSSGDKIDISADKSISEIAGDSLSMNSKKINSDASSKLEISSKKVDVQGSSLVNVKGGKIKLN